MINDKGNRLWAALQTGATFALTVAVFYTLCTVIWVLAPDNFLQFMNDLFHGIDFSGLVKTSAFSWSAYLSATLVLSAWAFCFGSFFAYLQAWLSACSNSSCRD